MNRLHAGTGAAGRGGGLSERLQPLAAGGLSPPLVLFLILMLAGAGLLSYVRLGRAEDPSFTIKVMMVTARWPGATAAEMQDQVAERIEKKLQELPHVDRVETYTRPGFVAVTVKLRDDTPPGEVPDLWYQARKKINDIKPTLPEGVLGPQADDEYGDVYSGVYYFTGDGLDPGGPQAAGGGRPAPVPAAARRVQGGARRRPAGEGVRRVLARQARHPGRRPRGNCSTASPGRTRWPRPGAWTPPTTGCSSGSTGRWTRRPGAGGAGRGGREAVPARRRGRGARGATRTRRSSPSGTTGKPAVGCRWRWPRAGT